MASNSRGQILERKCGFLVRVYVGCDAQERRVVKWEMLTANVCLAVDLPKYRKPEMNAMAEGESNRFLDAAEGSPFHGLFALMLQR